MSPARGAALARFAIRTNLRSGMARGGMLAFALIAALGPLASWRGGRGWALDEQLLFYGYLVGGLFVVRSGLEQQREGGLQTYLRQNFATPIEHAVGAVLAILGSWVVLTGLLFLLALVYAGGDAGTAAWYAWTFGLALSLLLPFTLMVEAVGSFRIPLLLPVIGYLALIVGLSLVLGEARMAVLVGVSAARDDPASWLRLVGRAATVVPAGMAVFLAATWARTRLWGARPRDVTSRH